MSICGAQLVLGRQILPGRAVRDCSGLCMIHQMRKKCCGDLDPGPKIEAASRDIFWILTLLAASIASMTH